MCMDVSSAFLYAPMQREVFIELPEEDEEGRKRGLIGRLKRALYGTRDAPQAWQEELTRAMKDMGFVGSKLHPALFFHPGRDVEVVVHVDDLLCGGELDDLEWFRDNLKKRYEVTGSTPESW